LPSTGWHRPTARELSFALQEDSYAGVTDAPAVPPATNTTSAATESAADAASLNSTFITQQLGE
jgi:hypothetical protein